MEAKPKLVKSTSKAHNPVHANPQTPVKEHPLVKIIGKRVTIYLRGEKLNISGTFSEYKEGLLLITDAITPSGPRDWVLADRSSVILIQPE